MSPAPQPSVRILVTGGTLDKVHDARAEALAFGDETHIGALLREARAEFEFDVLFLKDSLELTTDECGAILTAILECEADRVVITHGTSRLGETARFLAPELAARASGKTVVLTGAMRPFSFGASDASFNLGGALVAAQTLPAGVYAVMNGRVFQATDIQKNTELGRFDR
ncbi:MAG: asparaginase [Neomegalonema sp.]|nr:asparaginase [Neomegalonema sp.]